MLRLKFKSKKVGESPGALPENKGNVLSNNVLDIDILDYKDDHIEEKNIFEVEECFLYKEKDTVTWINIEGTDKVSEIEKLGKHFGLHPLILEDIVYADQRPKIDDYEDHIFIILKMLDYDSTKKEIKSEQISLVLGENYVISFQENEKKGDIFNPNRDRIKNNKGKIRRMGADYLLYTLIDTVVDHYFIILEKIGERIEDLESKLIFDPNPHKLRELYQLKREMIYLRKSVWPLREVLSRIERADFPMITPSTIVYLKDVYDHTIQIIDTIESYRDILGGILDLYLSSTSNKMNSVMKVLTVISTIFMPLTFIVGIYGMNFKNMPELETSNGYFFTLGVCFLIACIMIIYFKKKKWL